MPTHSMPRLARASSAALVALAFAACSDSTGPNTIPNAAQAEQAAFMISQEIMNSLTGLTADAAMSAPTAAVAARSVAPFRGSAAALRAECGAYSPATPVDTDADGIFDDVTVSFTLPDCHYPDDLGGWMDLTGSMRVEDETPQTAGMSFSLALTNLRIRIHDGESGDDIVVTQNGNGSVAHSGTNLTQIHNFVTAISAFGITSSLSANWNNAFDAAPGSSIVPGEPLPNGTFTPTGTTSMVQGPNHFTFALSAPTALAYSAACAADTFTYDNPFTDGVLHVNLSGTEGSAYVEIAYADCMEPVITYYDGSIAH